MPGSTYSTNLKVELMATGENSGTWGDITNTNLGTALEQAIVGYGNPDYASDANLTISITNSNAAQAARALVLNVTSSLSLTATRELVVPTIQKQYIVQNNTTGGQSITVKTSAGTGITVPNGRKAHLYVDGTNVIQMFDFVDINGGTIDGATVGASSASSGAFTTLTASGATTLNGAVTLGDAAADNITFNGTVTSHLLFTDNTYDIGASGATRPRNLYLAGAATIGGNLSVGGTLTLTGGLTLNGNVTVGDSSSDTLTINSTITSNLIFTDNTYDIGASGATRPRNLFLAGNATIGGNQTLTGSLTVDSTTDTSSATTGSIQTDGGVGIAKGLYVGGNTTLGDAAADNVTVNGTITSNLIFTDNTYDIGASGATRPRNLYLAGSATLGTALSVPNGGTGLTSLTAGYIPFGAGTSAFGNSANLFWDSSNTRLGLGTNSPLTLLDVRGGYITAGTASSVNGTKVLGGYYTNGNIATWGTEYSNGSPVMGYGVWPSTSASGAFVSSTGITVARGAYSIVGNQHFWYSGGAQTVAVDGAVSTSVIGKFDDFGRFLVGTTNNFGGAGQFAINQSGGSIPAIHLIGTNGVGGGGREIGAIFSVVTNDTGPAYGNVAKISAAKENATQGNTAGYMAFQTTPNGGTLTERGRFDSGGNLMINRTNRQNNGKLEVLADASAQAIVAQVQTNGNSLFQGFAAAGGSAVFQVTGSGDGYFSGVLGVGMSPNLTQLEVKQNTTYAFGINNSGGTRNYSWRIDSGTDALILGTRTTSTDLVTVTTNGDLLVGTNSSSGRLTVVNSAGAQAALFSCGSGTTQQAVATFSNTTNGGYLSIAGVGTSSSVSTWTNGSMVVEGVPYSSGNTFIGSYTGDLVFQNNRVNSGRFTSAGNFVVGADTASGGTQRGWVFLRNWFGAGDDALIIGHASAASGDPYMAFNYNGSAIGTITQNGTTAVAYNTSSDYRLKNVTGPVTTSGSYIDSLKPVEGTWKSDGSTFVGLIAHEVQEVSRTQIATGVKDGERMQGMDYSNSEFIANIIAELQSLRKRVAQLEQGV